MTSIDKKIEVVPDKEFYHLDDDIVIFVSARGYACDLKVVCLGENCLYPNSNYEIRNNMIILKPYILKGNGNKRSVEIGTITPTAGFNFLRYPFRKILYPFINDKRVEYVSPVKSYENFESYTSTTVNIVF
jgi:hypothetical protein